ncbi:head maturation protease [Cronobacter phage vB_CsaM_GAP32]|uniref:ATP-dependent Clp protease proteolytic subunit n=1 Tax=Cronobacter phage vB_CsaM_GAP32 TaxID=1141136 RepID=K4F5Q9_9CAUD|nr:head maturation protease [Cronobacter phage vB_CsaM_GAP32]AFC21551.1 ATP-dependent Clp protease proteolytic subunit [Cronobacter phage vB_CsaM_GAP32]
MFNNSILDTTDTTPSNYSIPIVLERSADGERSYDLASRMMAERIIMIDSDFNAQMAHIIKMQLMYLDSRDKKPITMYVSSPGGSVHDGLGIKDVAKNCRSPIKTIVMGYAASMGCYTQSVMGTPGMRLMGADSFIMAHQVSSGTKGLITDQKIALQHSERLNELLTKQIAEAVGVSHEDFLKDVDRDLWLNAEEALNYGTKGFVDGILVGERNEKGQYKVKRRDGSFDWV